MTRRSLTSILLALGCLLAYLALSIHLPQAPLAQEARAEPAAAKAGTQPADQIAQLRARVEQLEKQGQTLQRQTVFPDIVTSPEAVKPLQGLVEARLRSWRQVYAKYMSGAPGGSVTDEARARTYLYLGLAQLAWAERHDRDALEQLENAIQTADRMVAAEQAAYEEGILTLDVVLEAQRLRAELKAIYLRAGGTPPKADDERPWTPPPGIMPEPYSN
jgi:cell division protein FtsB